MDNFNINDFIKKISERFNKIEDSLIMAHQKIDNINGYLKQIESVGEKMSDSIERITSVKEVLNVHERALEGIQKALNDFSEFGFKNADENNKIDYDLLLKKLAKTNKDIIMNEVQFFLKQKK